MIGKIYKLVCNTSGNVYIGSTSRETINHRLVGHIADYKYYQQGKRSFVNSFKILENNNYEIILIEEFPYERKTDLYARERYHIENTICINKNIPGRSTLEWQNKEWKKQYYKQYYLNHR